MEERARNNCLCQDELSKDTGLAFPVTYLTNGNTPHSGK